MRQSTASRVYVFVDASGSLIGPQHWDIILRITEELLSRVDASIPVTVEVLAESSRVLTDRSEVLPYLRNLGALSATAHPLGKKTRLYDALVSAVGLQYFDMSDAVFIISDGGDNESRTKSETLAGIFKSRGIRPIFLVPDFELEDLKKASVYTTRNSYVIATESQVQQELDNLTRTTGGLVLWLPGKGRNRKTPLVPNAFYAQSLTFYMLNFEAPPSQGQSLKVLVLRPLDAPPRQLDIRTADRLPDCRNR